MLYCLGAIFRCLYCETIRSYYSGIQITVEKLIQKKKKNAAINHNESKQLDEPIRVPDNYLSRAQAREKLRVQGAIGFGFASHCLKNWREVLKPITKHSKRNGVITFDSHLKIDPGIPEWNVYHGEILTGVAGRDQMIFRQVFIRDGGPDSPIQISLVRSRFHPNP